MSNEKDRASFFSWKIILVVLFILGAIFLFKEKSDHISIKTDSIGKVLIEGIITDEKDLVEKLKILSENQKLKGLIIEVDSPGGAVVPSYRIYDAIRKISDGGKPVAIVMKSVAASGGYLISTAGDYIIAHPSTITGSIGVVMYTADVTNLMDKIGVKPLIFKTGKLKASPAIGEKLTPDVEAMMDEILNGTKKQFMDLVLSRRNITDQKIIDDISNSGIYLGDKAKSLGLIDEVGDVDQAIEWMKSKKNLDFKVQNITLKVKKKSSIFDVIKSSTNNSNFDHLNNILNEISNQIKRKGVYLLYTE